jgi:coatomer subunit beta
VTPWQLWLDECRAAFTALTADKQLREAAELAAESARTVSQPDDLIDFTHLRARKVRGIGGGAVEAGDDRMQG